MPAPARDAAELIRRRYEEVSARLSEGRTAVYRFYDDADRLLYVGITANLGPRFGDHERLSSWWSAQRHVKVSWRDTRSEAADEELRAIRTERPLHNVAGNPRVPGRVRPDPLTPDQVEITRRVNLHASYDGRPHDQVRDALGLHPRAVRARLRGRVPFHPTELERIAAHLGVPVTLLAPAQVTS